MGFAGDLKDLSLADLLQSIGQNRHTGTLFIYGVGEEKDAIFFQDGLLSAVPLPVGKDVQGFADVLRRTRAMPARELDKALKKKGRKLLRTQLEEMGAMTPDAFKAAAENFVRDSVCDLFLKGRGRFEFKEGEPERGVFDPDLRSAKASVECAGVIMEGSRRVDEWSRLSRRIGSLEEVYVRTGAAPAGPDEGEGATITGEAIELLELIDGRRDVNACVALLPCGRFRTLEALGELLDAHLVRIATPDELAALADQAERASEPETAVAFYRRGLELARNAIPLRERLAELLERTGRREEAAQERKLLGFSRAAAGDVAGAVADYMRAAELQPTDATALERALELTRQKRDHTAALATGRRLAERYLHLGLPERSRAIFMELLNDHPGDPVLGEQLGEVLERMGEKHEAASTWKRIGRDHDRKKDAGAAAEAYRRALSVDPQDEEARRRLDDLETGRREKRAHAIRRAAGVAVLTAVVMATVLAAAREILARDALMAVHEATTFNIWAYSDRDRDGRRDEDRVDWIPQYLAVARAYPYTLAGSDARRIARGIHDVERDRVLEYKNAKENELKVKGYALEVRLASAPQP